MVWMISWFFYSLRTLTVLKMNEMHGESDMRRYWRASPTSKGT